MSQQGPSPLANIRAMIEQAVAEGQLPPEIGQQAIAMLDQGAPPEEVVAFIEQAMQQAQMGGLTIEQAAQAPTVGVERPQIVRRTVDRAADGALVLTVRARDEYLPEFFPLPHPSPRNRLWMKKNAWFEREGIYGNAERRLQQFDRLVAPPGSSSPTRATARLAARSMWARP